MRASVPPHSSARRCRAVLAALLCAGGTGCRPDLPTALVDAPASLLRIRPTAITLAPGDSARLRTTVYDAAGSEITPPLQWTVLDPGTVRLSTQGMLVAAAIGSARVVARVASDGPADTITVTVDTLLHFASGSLTTCTGLASGRARIVGRGREVWLAEDLDNPAGSLSDADYASIMRAVDTLTAPLTRRTLGPWTDLDANARIVVLYTRLINELTPPGATSFIAGLFTSRDLLPRRGFGRFTACPGSYEGEIVYMLAPDPAGKVGGNVRTAALVRRVSIGTIGHELQHLVNAGSRFYEQQGAPSDEIWLNEGLSHVMEERAYLAATGTQPRTLLGAEVFAPPSDPTAPYQRFLRPDVDRLGTWYANPAAQGAFDRDADLPTRGAIWQFLRYAIDRVVGTNPLAREDAILSSLVRSTEKGTANLTRALGADWPSWTHDWAVGNAANAMGLQAAAADARWRRRSWDYDAILAVSAQPPVALGLLPLDSAGAIRLSLPAGGAAFLRFDTAPGVTTRIHLGTQVVSTLPHCAAVARLTLEPGSIRPLTIAGSSLSTDSLLTSDATGSTLCLMPALATARFLLVATPAEPQPGATVAVGITADGITATPSRIAPVLRSTLQATSTQSAKSTDAEAEFRRAEAALLGASIRNTSASAARAPTASGASVVTGGGLALTLIRLPD